MERNDVVEDVPSSVPALGSGGSSLPLADAAGPRVVRSGRRIVGVVGAGRVTLRDTASRLGLSDKSIWRLMERGELVPIDRDPPAKSLPHGRLWFDAAEVEKVRLSRARLAKARMILRGEVDGDIDLEDEDLLTTGEAGLLLGVTAAAIAHRIRLGRMPASKTRGGNSRIAYGDIRAIVESRRSK
jgi:predicted DNA-binding transcriptional regulator AlpA